MKLLVFIRKLIAMNFYVNPHVDKTQLCVLAKKQHISELNVGQEYVVYAVNRTSGEVWLKCR